MRAIKIDVEKQEIYEFEFVGGLDAIYSAIGNNCTTFECPIDFASAKNMANSLYCDEEINYRLEDVKGAFKMEGWSYPIINNAIIVGTNKDGEDCDHDINIESLKSEIEWLGWNH